MHYSKNNFKNKLKRSFLTIIPSVLSVSFWTLMMFGFDKPYIASLSIISAAIHECGHIFAASALGCNSGAPTPFLRGMKIKYKRPVSYKNSIAILLYGPLANIFVFIATIPFFDALSGYIGIFGLINLLCAVSNLAPIDGNDGYGAIKLILSYYDFTLGFKLLDYSSLILTASITILSAYSVDRLNTGYWALCVFLIATVSKCCKMLRHGNFENY